ncbi:YkgJ family cysteine cluster protein [Candidatus Pacearchaeota archaeon]|nr:YkgJ family cysteine cluster protein [Candidatus Pacearchaeota archaeon]
MEDECFECGACCKLFLIDLTKAEYQSKKYKTQFMEFGLISDFDLAQECGANIIEQDTDESCIYLKDGKCSIHKIRPEACREFFCSSKEDRFKGMIELIKKTKNDQKSG